MLPTPSWSAKSVVALSAVILISVILVKSLLAIFPVQSHLESLLTVPVVFHGTIFICVALFLRKEKLDWSEAFGFNNRPLGRVYAIGLLSGGLLVPPVLILNSLSSSALARIGISGELLAPGQPLADTHIWFVGVVAIFGSSLAEEVLFRGIIFPTFCKAGFPQLGLWASSFLYAAANLSLQRLVPLALLGLVCALLFKRFGNLWASILAHGSFNAVNFGILILQR